MTRRYILAAVCLSVSAIARGQVPETGSHVGRASPADYPDYEVSPADRARYTVDAWGRCVVGRYRQPVERAIAFPINDRAIGKLTSMDCVRTGELEVPTTVLRGAIYRALYATTFARAVPGMAAAPLDFSRDIDARDPRAAEHRSLRRYIDCVVRENPGGSRALVLAPTGSAPERRALGTIRPALSDCMNQGQTLTFSRDVLIAILSEVLFREARAAGDAPTPEGHN